MHALGFFFLHTLQRDWEVVDLLRVRLPRKLPVVLSRGEVRGILKTVEHPVRRMALTTLYALGLRLGEGLALEISHIDSERLVVWVRDGKGARDRGIPLPRPLLARLRLYWKLPAHRQRRHRKRRQSRCWPSRQEQRPALERDRPPRVLALRALQQSDRLPRFWKYLSRRYVAEVAEAA